MKPENEGQFHTEWIDRYLSEELQGQELEQFKHRLQTDVAFRQEVAVQRSIITQTHQLGREDLRQQLKSLHRQQGFAKEKTKVISFNYYAVAASLLLLLAFTAVFYFSNRTAPNTPSIAQVKNPVLTSQPLLIPFQVKGQQPTLGFTGTHKDSTITILLYPATTPAYQFNDTLRLHGKFTAEQLTLQYDQAKEQYTLLINDSLSYPLQRFRPKQALPRVR